MRELNQIRDAVVTALRAAGLCTLASYPDQRARRYAGPVAAVAVDTADSATIWARSATLKRDRCGSCTASSWTR